MTVPDSRILIAHRLRSEAAEKLAEAERLELEARGGRQSWAAPKPPDEPPMTVVRVCRPAPAAGDRMWWHIRPGQWYPASRLADRVALANLRPTECDTWKYVLSVVERVVDDTEPGERPLTELMR